MNISSNARDALRAVANESPENKIHRSRKIIIDLEKNPDETSHRVCQDLRSTLRSVQMSETASADEVAEAGALLLRVKEIDPRRLKRIADETGQDVEEDEASPVVAGISESQKGSLISYDELSRRITSKMGHPIWLQLHESQCSVSVDQGTEILHAATGKTFLWGEDVQALLVSFDKLPAGKLPALVRIAQEYLERVQVLFEKWKQMIKEIQSGVMQ